MNGSWKMHAVKALSALLCLAFVCAIAEAAEKRTAASGALSGRLLLSGSSTMAPLMKEIGKRFQALHPNVRIEVQAGGSERGIGDVRGGKADIGMVSRALTGQESDLYGFPIARDGVCLILHRENPVRTLTDRQVADIYTGRIGNWKKVGGRDAPITVLNPKAGYASTKLFTEYFNIRSADIRADQVVGDNPTRIRAIADNPNAIAYVSVGEAERTAQAGAPIKLMPMDGVAASSTNILSGNFPIFRPLTLVTRRLPAGVAKAFIEFSLSSQVTALVQTHNFVPYPD